MVNEPSGREPDKKLTLMLSGRMDSLENLVKVGFVVMLVMVATMLMDYWSVKNDLSQERYQLLKEQINSKCI